MIPQPSAQTAVSAVKPVTEWRAVMNDDFLNQFGGNTTADVFRARVDFIARAGVDARAPIHLTELEIVVQKPTEPRQDR